MTQASEFLSAFQNGGPWFVTAIKDHHLHSESVTTAEALDAFIERYNGADYYFTPGALASIPQTAKPSKENMLGSWWAWVDKDPPKDCPDLNAWRATALTMLKLSNPSVIIDSGRGFWGLWQLSTFTDPATVENLNKRLAMLLGGDSAHNIDRIARLPGTINSKTGQAAQVVHWQPGPAKLPPLPEIAPVATTAPQTWTTTHVRGSPIVDDRTLIEKALASSSFQTVHGGKAYFRDLWNRNEQALVAIWPRSLPIPTGKAPWNESDADAALFYRLAWWTGSNCERMERILRGSPAYRPKWEERRGNMTWLQQEIMSAAAVQRQAYGKDEPQQPVADVPVSDRSTDSFLNAEQQHDYFRDCAYIASLHRVLTPNGDLLNPDRFKAMFAGKTFELDMTGKNNSTTNAFTAFTENRLTSFTKVDDQCFRPDRPPREIIERSGRRSINTYIPEHVVMTPGDPGPFQRHLAKILPNDRDRVIFECYLAALIQHPGAKFNWCPLLQGVEGNGKRIILDTAEYIVGPRYTHWPSAKELAESGLKFTGWLYRKLLIVIEEIHVRERADMLDGLKPMISDNKIEIQLKGQDQFTAENVANFILTSNFKDAVRKNKNDRRYAIFFTAHQQVEDLARDGMDETYFGDLWDWLRADGFAIVAHWLANYPIPDELNPATGCRRAPVTSSTDEAIRETLGVVEQYILEAVSEHRAGFCGNWISLYKAKELIKETRRSIVPGKWVKILEDLGYVPHPALHNGQVNQPIGQEGGTRPRLFVKVNSIPHLNLLTGRDAFTNYCAAQGYTFDAAKSEPG